MILGAALLLRVAALSQFGHTFVFPVLKFSDSDSYYTFAKDIVAGAGPWTSKVFMTWPLYAYFAAFFLKISSGNPAAVFLAQIALGGAHVWVMYRIGRNLFNRTTGCLAAGLAAFNVWFVFYDLLFVYVSLSLFLNSFFLLIFLKWKEALSTTRAIFLGMVLGLGALAQPNAVLFGWVALWLAAKKKRTLATFGAAFFLVLAVPTFRNYLVEKKFVPVSANVGFNWYLGNGPEADGYFHYPVNMAGNKEGLARDSRILANIAAGRRLKPSEVSAYWTGQTWDYIRQKPLSFARLLVKKVLLIFSPREFGQDAEYLFTRENVRAFSWAFIDAAWILPLALVGALAALRRWRETWVLYAQIAGIAASVALFFVMTKLRLAIVPALTVFAAYGLFHLYEMLARRQMRRLVLLISVVLACAVFSYRETALRRTRPTPDYEDYVVAAGVYEREGRFDQALRHFEAAAALNPDSYYPYYSIGGIYYRMNDWVAAEIYFKKSLERYPMQVDSAFNLGLLYINLNRPNEAKQVLARALEFDDEEPGLHYLLGRAKKMTGDKIGAREAFEGARSRMSLWRKGDLDLIQKELNGP